MARRRHEPTEWRDRERGPVADGETEDGGPHADGLQAHLRRWQAAQIIDARQMNRILAFERAAARRHAADAWARPGLLEAFVYLGLAVAGVGVIALTAQHWDALGSGTRIGVCAVPGLLALLAGLVLRAAAAPQLNRAVGMAWLAAVALLAGAVAVAGVEVGWDGEDAALAAGVGATLLAVLLWGAHRAHPQVIALAGSLVLLVEALANHRLDAHGNPDTTLQGLLVLALGAGGVALAEVGVLTPRLSARAAGAAGVVAGPFLAGYAYDYTDVVWAQLLLVVAGGGLVALSLRRASLTYLVFGVAGIFLGLVAFIFKHFEEEIGAPVALILSGVLLVAATVLVATVRTRLHRPVAELPSR